MNPLLDKYHFPIPLSPVRCIRCGFDVAGMGLISVCPKCFSCPLCVGRA